MGRFGREAPVSEVDAQRALLDSLMGVNRNQEGADVLDFKDERLCRCYFYGVCPKEGFTNTRMACGTCRLIHDDGFKESYTSQAEDSRDAWLYDDEVEAEFTQHLMEAEKVIKRARSRIEEDGSGRSGGSSSSASSAPPVVNPETHTDVLALRARIELLSAEAEAAGNEGDIDKAQALATQMEELQKEKQTIINKLEDEKRAAAQKTGGVTMADVNKKLRVCDICGSLLSIHDSDARLADHFLGKQHLTFQRMRDAVDEIKARRKKRHEAGWSRDRGGERDSRSRDRSRDRSSRPAGGSGGYYGPGPVAGSSSRDRDRDRDRGRDRVGYSRDIPANSARGDRVLDRDRDRDRDRPRGRSGDRDRDRDRDKDRDRDRDRERERDRDRDRNSSMSTRLPAVAPSRPVLLSGKYYDGLDRYVKDHPVIVEVHFPGDTNNSSSTPAPDGENKVRASASSSFSSSSTSGGLFDIIPSHQDIVEEVNQLNRHSDGAGKTTSSSCSSAGASGSSKADPRSSVATTAFASSKRKTGESRDNNCGARDGAAAGYSSDSSVASAMSRSSSSTYSSYSSRSRSYSSSSYSSYSSSACSSESEAEAGQISSRSRRDGLSSSHAARRQKPDDYSKQHEAFMAAQEKKRHARMATVSAAGGSSRKAGEREKDSSEGDRRKQRGRRGGRHRNKTAEGSGDKGSHTKKHRSGPR